MTTTTTTTAFPANSCRLGAGIVSTLEASEAVKCGRATPLAITNARGDTEFYWLMPMVVGGESLGYRLLKDDGSGEMYDLPTSLAACACPDHKYRRRQCKHMKALVACRKRKLIP